MNSIQQLWRDPYAKFIMLFLGVSALLYYFNIAYIGVTAKGGLYVPFLAENLNYIEWWRTLSIECTAKILRAMDYVVYTNDTQLKVIGRSGFTLVYECLGYGVMSVFIAFCISFPEPFRNRFAFMIGGLITIQTLNITRFVLLSLFWKKYRTFLAIDHHTLFNVLLYSVLIAICYFWIRYSTKTNDA